MNKLIEKATTLRRTAKAGYLDILKWKFVVIGNLLVHADRLLGIDDNLLLSFHRDDFRITVWLQTKRKRNEKRIVSWENL